MEILSFIPAPDKVQVLIQLCDKVLSITCDRSVVFFGYSDFILK